VLPPGAERREPRHRPVRHREVQRHGRRGRDNRWELRRALHPARHLGQLREEARPGPRRQNERLQRARQPGLNPVHLDRALLRRAPDPRLPC
jgi:hypothetical protein